MGWSVNEENGTIKQDIVTALRVMSDTNLTYPPESTTQAFVSGVLDKNDTNVTSANGKAITLNFFDKLGYTYTAKLVFKQSSDPSSYSAEIDKIIDSDGQDMDISNLVFGNQGNAQAKQSTVTFNTEGYTWDKENMLLKSADGTTTYAGIREMFSGTTLKNSSEVINVNGVEMTVGESLDAIAKAYGYEGSTSEFLNLYIETGENVTDIDGVTGTVKTKTSIRQMLSNLANNSEGEKFPLLPEDDGTNSFETAGRYYNGVNVVFDSTTGKFAGIGGSSAQKSATLEMSKLGDQFSDINIDFSSVTMFDNNGTSTIGATSGDLDGIGTGRSLGKMIGISTQNNGMIYASYDNGMTKLLGQIATASFSNVSGLEKAGDNLYKTSRNSGEFDGIGVDVTAGGGYISTSQLEMSNVDLSQEFTEMITTQRGFQANSRIITVSDTMIEELTNLKR